MGRRAVLWKLVPGRSAAQVRAHDLSKRTQKLHQEQLGGIAEAIMGALDGTGSDPILGPASAAKIQEVINHSKGAVASALAKLEAAGFLRKSST